MTVASDARVARRRARKWDRGTAVVDAATVLAERAECDATISGASLFLPGGEIKYFSVRDALRILGRLPAAGSA